MFFCMLVFYLNTTFLFKNPDRMWTFRDDCTEWIQPSLTFKASYSCKLLSLPSPSILFQDYFEHKTMFKFKIFILRSSQVSHLLWVTLHIYKPYLVKPRELVSRRRSRSLLKVHDLNKTKPIKSRFSHAHRYPLISIWATIRKKFILNLTLY